MIGKAAGTIFGGILAVASGILLATKPDGWLGWLIGSLLAASWIVWLIELGEGTRGFAREFRRGWQEKA